jgi:hypothetical protein
MPRAHGIAEIDHLLTYVPNLTEASDALQQLGFSLSPLSDIEAMGIQNRLVLLTPRTPGAASFIELMTAAEPTRLPASMRTLLQGEPGIRSMVMFTPDARLAYELLVQNNYPFAPPVHVEREWKIPSEGSVWPRFDVLLPISAPLTFNACQYHNVELYQREDWQQHANGAITLEAVMAISPTPEKVANYFGNLFQSSPQERELGSWVLNTFATHLEVLSTAAVAASYGAIVKATSTRYFGYRIGVRSLEALAALFDRNKVPFVQIDRGLVTSPDQGCGNWIEWVQA